MAIKIEYALPDKDVLKIRFMQRRNELYNVSYNISGLTNAEVLELKKEAAAKFCKAFPDIPLKAVLQGFKAVDPLMQEYYKQTFPHGGSRGGGRPFGTLRSNKKARFTKAISEEEKIYLEKCLEDFRKKNKGD